MVLDEELVVVWFVLMALSVGLHGVGQLCAGQPGAGGDAIGSLGRPV